MQLTRLEGNKVPGARFGSAITNIGDINNDGYQGVFLTRSKEVFWLKVTTSSYAQQFDLTSKCQRPIRLVEIEV